MKNLKENKFGELNVIELFDKKGSFRIWHCKCNCGNESNVYEHNLLSGATISCGKCSSNGDLTFCKEKKVFNEYKIWIGIKSRCSSSNGHKDYGGRGITICDRWLKFENFYNDMGKRHSKKHSIDRANNNGNYAPSNCRWVTQKEQMRNTRANKMIEYNGETKCLVEWCEIIGVSYSTIAKRLSDGWNVYKALNKPIRLAPPWNKK